MLVFLVNPHKMYSKGAECWELLALPDAMWHHLECVEVVTFNHLVNISCDSDLSVHANIQIVQNQDQKQLVEKKEKK